MNRRSTRAEPLHAAHEDVQPNSAPRVSGWAGHVRTVFFRRCEKLARGTLVQPLHY